MTGFLSEPDNAVLLAKVFGGLVVVSFLASLVSVYKLIAPGSKKPRRWLLLALAPLVCAFGIAMMTMVLPAVIDSALNPVLQDQSLPPLSPKATALHKSLFVVDLHSDSLMWASRDLTQRNDFGHVDVPRLIEGNVALQAFTIVTSSPSGLNFERNPYPTLAGDSITLKALVERWGVDAITSKAARTLFQAARLHEVASRVSHNLYVIHNQKELKDYIELRKTQANITAGFLGIEGLHALDGNLTNVDTFYDAGIRMMAPTHFFDNELGGSAHGLEKGGITEFGKQVIKRMNEKHIIVDIAHASMPLIDDIIKVSTAPIMSSHTGIRGVCDNTRNLKDEHIRAVARSGGILGIAYFKPALCGNNLIQSIVDSMKYVKRLVGVEHIALGSDFDGTVATPFDTTGLVHLTNALLAAGFSEHEIRLIMGENTQRFLLNNLPTN